MIADIWDLVAAAAVDIPPPRINGTLRDGNSTSPYSASLDIVDGLPSFNVTNSSGWLPPGIEMSYAGSVITFAGQPTTAGSYSFTILVVVRHSHDREFSAVPGVAAWRFVRCCVGNAGGLNNRKLPVASLPVGTTCP